MNRADLAIQYLTTSDAETINACLCLCHTIFYGENKHLATEDDRITQEKLENTILKLMPQKDFKRLSSEQNN